MVEGISWINKENANLFTYSEKHTALRRTPGKYDDLLTTDYNKIAVAVQQISKVVYFYFSSSTLPFFSSFFPFHKFLFCIDL